jgi:hypothetical protein
MYQRDRLEKRKDDSVSRNEIDASAENM